jgi:large subunit ribosomal protein L5
MTQIRVEKVTVNVGVGEVGQQVETAVKLLQDMTEKDPVRTQSSRDAQSFGMREGLNIGAKVTLRGEDAEAFLEYVFEANDNEVPEQVFDTQGNFSIGVSEYINMPNMQYDPDLGMIGFDVAVTLERPGYRVKKRKQADDLSDDHRISPDEAQAFVQDRFGVDVVE